jgi:hypothetical protein
VIGSLWETDPNVASEFARDSPLEEGVSSEPVSEVGDPAAAGIRRHSEGFMDG